MSINLKQLHHIADILDERISLYKKRGLETKRAMKAMHRANILPDPFRLQIMLEACISYEINMIGKKALEKTIAKLKIEKTINFYKKIKDEFFNIFESNNLLLNRLNPSKEKMLPLIDVVFSLDENYQRNEITKFIVGFSDKLVKFVFNGIAIFDAQFIKTVVKDLNAFLVNE